MNLKEGAAAGATAETKQGQLDLAAIDALYRSGEVVTGDIDSATSYAAANTLLLEGYKPIAGILGNRLLPSYALFRQSGRALSSLIENPHDELEPIAGPYLVIAEDSTYDFDIRTNGVMLYVQHGSGFDGTPLGQRLIKRGRTVAEQAGQ